MVLLSAFEQLLYSNVHLLYKYAANGEIQIPWFLHSKLSY